MRATMVRMLLITTMMLIFELRIVKLSAMELFFEGDSNLQPIWDSDGVGISELQGEPVNLQKEEALEELKETLGIRGNFKKDSYKDTPPQFMTELYNTITDSTGKTRMKNPFNAAIVRSFIGRDSSSVGYFIFNVSGLDQNEFVLEAELHLYRQRSSPKSMPLSVLSSPYYLVKVYQVLQDKSLGVPDLHRLLNVHYVGAYASGWQVFNVKQAVLSWLSGIPNLGLLVSATTIFGDPVSINFSSRHDLPHEKQPILVLFNDDNVQVYPKQIVNHEKEDKVDNKQRAIADLEDEEIVFMNSIIESDKEREKRNARATKGQPEEALEVITGNRPKKFRREKKPQAQADVNRSQKMHEFVSRRKSLENTLTSLDIYQRAMLREKLNLRKQDIIRPEILHNSLKVKREAASASSVTIAAPTDECSKPQLEPCAKHELYVNFRDIGLSTIIAPEGYAAYQCRGHCESPLSQEQKPTNHATIQGIIHKMNLASSEDVQTPCCVPVNLSSISILYHDEERDGVVLKSYADMAVLIPRLGRRTGNGSTQEEKADNDLLDSPESLSSGKSLTKKSAPVAPPRTRKTGWGEDLKSAKQKGLFSAVDQERFVIGSKNSKDDDIPVIPDLDDIIEDTSAIDISSTPAVGASRAAAAYKELNTDLLKNKLFSKYDDVDLSILTEKLYPEHLVQEPDEVWTWDSLFAQVASEINSESQSKVKEKQ